MVCNNTSKGILNTLQFVKFLNIYIFCCTISGVGTSSSGYILSEITQVQT